MRSPRIAAAPRPPQQSSFALGERPGNTPLPGATSGTAIPFFASFASVPETIEWFGWTSRAIATACAASAKHSSASSDLISACQNPIPRSRACFC